MITRRNGAYLFRRRSNGRVLRLYPSSRLLSVLITVFVSFAMGLAVLYVLMTKDVHGFAVDVVSMHTSWLVAPPSEVKHGILASKEHSFSTKSLQEATGPLRVDPENPRYFSDGSGKIVYLTGSHTWSNFQDNGGSDPPPTFDYDQYLDFLVANNHNFFRLWTWEQSRWTNETEDNDYWFYPNSPYVRTGPGTALDGKPKWDLTQFDPDYFERMRDRTVAAGDKGLYVAIVLFNGWSVRDLGWAKNPWEGHPFNDANNINGVDGDINNDNSGEESHELASPQLLAYQEAYVRKVIDTVNDLDNVLYEVSNESHAGSYEWQYHIVDVIKEYEATKPKQHPVGMTVAWPGSNAELFASDADWVAPNGYQDPPQADGSKVIIADTDHIFGIGGDRQWVWKSFTRGMNPIFMDGYDGAGYGVGGAGFDFNYPQWVSLRLNLGYTRSFAERMNLAKMLPRQDLCSTGYCLANPAANGAEFIVYLPTGGTASVDLTGTVGDLQVEWFDPEAGTTNIGTQVAGGANRNFTAPFSGDAVLYLYQPGASPTPTNTSVPPQQTATNTPVPPTATSTPEVVSITIGETNLMPIDDAGNGDLLVAQQVVLSQDATIQSLSFYVAQAVGRLRLGIYDDAGGNPSTLRTQTAEFTPVVGWNTQAPLTQTLLPAGTYWLAYLAESNDLHFRVDRATGTGRYQDQPFGEMPGTFPDPSLSETYTFSLYATFLVKGGTPTPEPPSLGDVNCDRKVDSVDAMFVLQYDGGMRSDASQCPLPPNTLYVSVCDVNSDGNCNDADALAILQCTVGMSNDLCP